MVHVAKKLDLAESPLGVDLVVEGIRDLLNRDMLVRLRIQGRATQTLTNSRIRFKDKRTLFRKRKEKKERVEQIYEPDDAVSAFADGHDGRLVLGGDLEYVAEDVVLYESPAVAQRRRDVLHPNMLLRRRRRILMFSLWGRRLRHDGVRRLSCSCSLHFWLL